MVLLCTLAFGLMCEVGKGQYYEQIYTGVSLVWTQFSCEGISGEMIVQHQDVISGVLVQMMYIQVDRILQYYEWCEAGWVQYSDGRKYVFIKWDTQATGWVSPDPRDNPIPQWGEELKVTLIMTNFPTVWRVQVFSERRSYINQLINFTNTVNRFGACLKSLSRINQADMKFQELLWYHDEFMNYWGNSTLGFHSRIDYYRKFYGIEWINYAYEFTINGKGSFRQGVFANRKYHLCVT